ncbi:hypothetical protein MKA59_18895 [[Clostridium] innocuum]|nr:hypothetical protein [[Clostridium] innocuum]
MSLGNEDYIIMTAPDEVCTQMQHVLESFRGLFDCHDGMRCRCYLWPGGHMRWGISIHA